VLHELLPATFPSGEGTDLAGIVLETGTDVTDFGVGDAVLGYSWTRSSHATHTVVPATQLIGKPEALPWEVAGALDVAGTTADARRAPPERRSAVIRRSRSVETVGDHVGQGLGRGFDLPVLRQDHVDVEGGGGLGLDDDEVVDVRRG